MNAYEARKIAEEALYETLPHYIKKQIQSSVDTGEMQCRVYKDLCNYTAETIKSLQDLGYWVDDVFTSDDGSYILIQWGDANHFVY